MVAVGAAFFIFKRQQEQAKKTMMPTSAVLMNAAYRPGPGQQDFKAQAGGFVFQSNNGGNGNNDGPIYAIPMDDGAASLGVQQPVYEVIPAKTNSLQRVVGGNWMTESSEGVNVAANNGTIYAIPMAEELNSQRPSHSSSMV